MLGLREWEMGAGMTVVRRGEPDGEGNRAAGDGGINAGCPVQWGGEIEEVSGE
jgi:hypothetical protein